jgi:uncharacterized protein YukE
VSEIRVSLERLEDVGLALRQAGEEAEGLARKLSRAATGLGEECKGAGAERFASELQKLSQIGQDYSATIREAERQIRQTVERLADLERWTQAPPE